MSEAEEAKNVHVLQWDESSHRQMMIFEDVELARDMADYIKASRGLGTTLTMMPVYGVTFVSSMTGKEYPHD